MSRVAKKPQFEAFNEQFNCYGRFQKHDLSLEDWRQKDRPLLLEVGAGTALISWQFSLNHPLWQVIALDRKSDRLNKTARHSQSQENLVFLQTELADLDSYLDLKKEVSLLWLAFPDPYPGRRRAKHRLISSDNLLFYRRLFQDNGRLRLKTDSRDLFLEAQQNLATTGYRLLESVTDLSQEGYENCRDDVRTITRYEARFLEAQKPIYYLEAAVSF